MLSLLTTINAGIIKNLFCIFCPEQTKAIPSILRWDDLFKVFHFQLDIFSVTIKILHLNIQSLP